MLRLKTKCSRLAAFISLLLFMICFAATQFPVTAQEDDPETQQDPVVIFNAGQDAHEKGDLPTAIIHYKNAIKLAPDFAEAHYQLASAYQSQGNKADAEKEFRLAVEHKPDWSLALTSLGTMLADNGSYDEALSFLNKAIEIDENNLPAYASIAEIKIAQNASKKELSDLLTKLRIGSSGANPALNVLLAKALLENALDDSAAAKKTLAAASMIAPSSFAVKFRLASAALIDNDLDTARSLADSLAKAGADADSVAVLRAQIAAADGDLDKALEFIGNLKQKNAQAEALKVKIAAARRSDPAELETALQRSPNDATVLNKLCWLYRVSSPELALDRCRRAVEADPKNSSSRIGYGAALVQAQRFEDAAVYLTTLRQSESDNATLHANLGIALFKLNRLPEAKNEYNWLIEHKIGLPAAYFFVAVIHDQLGEYLDSMANYQLFLKDADPEKFKLEIDKVNLRMPILQKQVKNMKRKN